MIQFILDIAGVMFVLWCLDRWEKGIKEEAKKLMREVRDEQ